LVVTHAYGDSNNKSNDADTACVVYHGPIWGSLFSHIKLIC
jgi:hypothetical protein